MKKSSKKVSKQEREIVRDLFRIAAFIAVLVIIYFVVSAYFKSLNHFTYEGLRFSKERYGELPVYHYYYYFKNMEGKLIQYNLFLLHDPRTNPVTVVGGPALFNKKTVYISIDESYPNCPDNLASIVDISTFFNDNQLNVEAAVTNRTLADELDKAYATCESRAGSEVIEFHGGNETVIKVDNNCHQIYVGPDCNVRQAVERLKLRTIIDARNGSEIVIS